MTDVLRQKVDEARALLRRVAREFAPAAFANSLGAEDMVLTDLICTRMLPIDVFTLDTGRLPVETYTLIDAIAVRYGTRLRVLSPRAELVESYVKDHGINGFYDSIELRQSCCHIRKVEPLRRALAGKRAWITGLRRAQSVTRGNLPVETFDTGHGMMKFNPLADWTEEEVWTYVRAHGVPYHALHDRGYSSIGCAPCTRAISAGEDVRAGRWWWEESALSKECGLHAEECGLHAAPDGRLQRAREEIA